MQRLGNAILKSAKEHMRSIEKKVECIDSPESIFQTERLNGETMPQMKREDELFVVETDSDIEYEDLLQNEESLFKFHVRNEEKEKIFPDEYKEAESYFKNRDFNGKSVSERLASKAKESHNSYEQYAEWFNAFKMAKKDINYRLRNGEEMSEETKSELLQGAEGNPFLKARLGEMYLYGKNIEVDFEKSNLYFEEALEIFEKDVDYIAVKENQFDFKSYLQYRIGKQYVHGWGTEYDPEVAAEWFEKSGTGYAMFALGNLYYTGEGVEQNFETAFECYRRAGNNPFANLKIAQMYEKGIGGEQNIAESELHFEIAFHQFCAAEEKEPDAIFEYRLGSMLYHGKGCEKDIDRAITYLEDAVKQKNMPATLLLSNIYMELGLTEQMPGVIAVLEELAGKGQNAAAQYTLGNIYTSDRKFYDLKKGVEQYGKAANQGNEYVQYRLGKLYLNPELEVYDCQKGIAYLESAAEQGNEFAQLKLGIEYIKGKSVERDLFTAREWLGKSAEQGNEIAKSVLDNLSSSGRQQSLGKLNPMNEFDKALMELRKSLYKSQEETMKNLMIYERELQEELEMPQGFYI